MTKNNKALLDLIGKRIVLEVRDRVIRKTINSIDGEIKSARSLTLHREFGQTGSKSLEPLISFIVDDTIHHFLTAIEDGDGIDITINDRGNREGIKELSDGLAGELYSDDGWIKKFSKYQASH